MQPLASQARGLPSIARRLEAGLSMRSPICWPPDCRIWALPSKSVTSGRGSATARTGTSSWLRISSSISAPGPTCCGRARRPVDPVEHRGALRAIDFALCPRVLLPRPLDLGSDYRSARLIRHERVPVLVSGARLLAALHRGTRGARSPGESCNGVSGTRGAHMGVVNPRSLRPIDVLFVGHVSSRRSRFFARAAPVLSRYRCCLHLSMPAPGGTERWRSHMTTAVAAGLAQRSKIVLDIRAAPIVRQESGLAWSSAVSGSERSWSASRAPPRRLSGPGSISSKCRSTALPPPSTTCCRKPG